MKFISEIWHSNSVWNSIWLHSKFIIFWIFIFFFWKSRQKWRRLHINIAWAWWWQIRLRKSSWTLASSAHSWNHFIECNINVSRSKLRVTCQRGCSRNFFSFWIGFYHICSSINVYFYFCFSRKNGVKTRMNLRKKWPNVLERVKKRFELYLTYSSVTISFTQVYFFILKSSKFTAKHKHNHRFLK